MALCAAAVGEHAKPAAWVLIQDAIRLRWSVWNADRLM
jgi:hypothetical protein